MAFFIWDSLQDPMAAEAGFLQSLGSSGGRSRRQVQFGVNWAPGPTPWKNDIPWKSPATQKQNQANRAFPAHFQFS
jgi:hypothetical protein